MSNIVELSAQEKRRRNWEMLALSFRTCSAIIYGLEKENENITVPFADILKELNRPGFFSRLLILKLETKRSVLNCTRYSITPRN